ncbi:hypothetical protein CQW23_19179 [Capsicum baccatum]|uniref:Uncharacterized protein n=1 Tax=Capsicum baccatum TaxID=33114 RepID=A0A2G2W519_CAPBA|nr:hypothetical protein CQW23_19179 [Capsicum baccatum]
MRGKLYIHFIVYLPESLTLELCRNLKAVLRPRTKQHVFDIELDECQETTLHDVNIGEKMCRKQQASQGSYAEDDDMHGGAMHRESNVQNSNLYRLVIIVRFEEEGKVE